MLSQNKTKLPSKFRALLQVSISKSQHIELIGSLSKIHFSIDSENFYSLGTTYTVTVQIRNKFGISEPLHVPVVTLLEPIKQLAETKLKNQEDRNEILAIILGGLVTAILLVIVILLVSFSYRRRLLEQSAPTTGSTSARLLETNQSEPHTVDNNKFSSYSIDSKPSPTTFNSNVFVPSISSELYGQVSWKYYTNFKTSRPVSKL